jgi:hypothetical protein
MTLDALITVASKKRLLGSSLLAKDPTLTSEWHPSKNGGVSAAEVHVGSPKKAWWLCVEGHEWFAVIRDRARKSAGCPYCNSKLPSATNCLANDSRAVALWHPTKNLPVTPLGVLPGSEKKFWWLCEKGHEWKAPPNHVVRLKSGCRHCRSGLESKGERQSRSIFESLTGHAFPKARPTWLVSKRGYQMELDGYCEALSLAFEFQGIQHFEQTPFFHNTTQSFDRDRQRDLEKREACAQVGVKLIEIRWDCLNLEGYIRLSLEGTLLKGKV